MDAFAQGKGLLSVWSEKPALGRECSRAGCSRGAVDAGAWSVGLPGTAGSLGSLQLSSSPSEQQHCGKPHKSSPGWSGVCACGRDADHLRARDALFRSEALSPVRNPAGEGDGDAQLWEQGNVCAILIQI